MPALTQWISLLKHLKSKEELYATHSSGHKRCRGFFNASWTYDLPTGSPIVREEASVWHSVQRLTYAPIQCGSMRLFLSSACLYSESDDGPSSISLNLRWHVFPSCKHMNLHAVMWTFSWVQALHKYETLLLQHPGCIITRAFFLDGFTQHWCMLDHFCIVRWIISGGG